MYPKPFIEYLIYFHTFRDYFECHEVLEEHWKDQGQQNQVWVGFIQLAVAMYHHRRENQAGAKKQLTQAISILKAEKEQVNQLGIDAEALLVILKVKLDQIIANLPYTAIQIPLKDQVLEQECKRASQQKGATWGTEPTPISNDIIHKHKLRDRSAIIAERDYQLKKRRGMEN